MPPAHVPDALRGGPFITATARAAGISAAALQSGPWRHVFRNVWVHRDLSDTKNLRLACVGLVLGDGMFVCGPSAAWLYGVDVQGPSSGLVWVGCLPGRRVRARPGCRVQQVTVAASHVWSSGSVPMTSPVRTAFDCSRWLPLSEGVVVADALAHGGMLTRDELRDFACNHRGMRGIRRCDVVMDLMDGRSESPMESRLRVVLIQAGLPRPTPQFVIDDAAGGFVARVDLAYPEVKLAVEYDGAWHWGERQHDDRRRQAIRETGWEVIVVGADAYYHHSDEVVGMVRRALARRAAC